MNVEHKFPAKGSQRLREGRTSFAEAYYHLSAAVAPGVAGIANEDCFRVIIECLDYQEREGGWRWLAVVVMPDHVHFLVRLGEGVTLGKLVQRFKAASAKRVNELRGGGGSMWYQGFHDRHVRKTSEIEAVIAYIRNNPVNAGLVKRAEDWPYTVVKEGVERV